ncbi:MAG: hypothetical protein ACP5NW_03455 [Candidatus Woesearchaeota archaeon]
MGLFSGYKKVDKNRSFVDIRKRMLAVKGSYEDNKDFLENVKAKYVLWSNPSNF